MRARTLTAALAALLLFLSACGGTGEAGQTGGDPVALGQAMTAQADSLPAMSMVTGEDERGEALFTYLSDLDYGKVAGYYFAYAEGGTAEEIAVIRLKDAADGAEAMASLERHVADRLGIFQVYSPEQVPMAEEARIVVSGEMAALFICGNAHEVASAFRQALAGE